MYVRVGVGREEHWCRVVVRYQVHDDRGRVCLSAAVCRRHEQFELGVALVAERGGRVYDHLADTRRHQFVDPEHVAAVAAGDGVRDGAGGRRVGVGRRHRGNGRAHGRALGHGDEVVGGTEDRGVVVVVRDRHREHVGRGAEGVDRPRVDGDDVEDVQWRHLAVQRRLHLDGTARCVHQERGVRRVELVRDDIIGVNIGGDDRGDAGAD